MGSRKLTALKFGVIVLFLGAVCAASAAPWGPTKFPPPQIAVVAAPQVAVMAPWGPTKFPPPNVAVMAPWGPTKFPPPNAA